MSLNVQRRRTFVTHPRFHNARPWEHRHRSTPSSRYPNYIGRDIQMVDWNRKTLHMQLDKSSAVLRPNATNSEDYVKTYLRTQNMCQQQTRFTPLGRDLLPQPLHRATWEPLVVVGGGGGGAETTAPCSCVNGRGLRYVMTGREAKANKPTRDEIRRQLAELQKSSGNLYYEEQIAQE